MSRSNPTTPDTSATIGELLIQLRTEDTYHHVTYGDGIYIVVKPASLGKQIGINCVGMGSIQVEWSHMCGLSIEVYSEDCPNEAVEVFEVGAEDLLKAPADHGLTAEQLDEKYEGDQHPRFTRTDWRMEVVEGSTLFGYWQWVERRCFEEDV